MRTSMSPTSLFAATVAIWGTTWIAIKFQLEAVAPELGVALRFSIAAAVVLALCAVRGIRLAQPVRVHGLLAAIGLLGFCISYLAVYHAERFIVSGLVAVGYAAAPLVNMLLARTLLGTPMSRRVALGGLLGLAGIALVFWPEFVRLQGNGPLLVGAAFTAGAVLASCLSNIGMARVQSVGVKGWAPLGIAMAWGAAAAWFSVLASGRPLAIGWSWPFVLSLAYLALAGSVLAFAAYYSLIGKIGPARAAYVGVMSTIVALLISALFEGYDWRLATFVGIALAVGGNVLALQSGPRPAHAVALRSAPGHGSRAA
jgi:drug/metabolite transporter (DMT)-like permease